MTFVVFPAPTGPKGLAYMPVLAGLAIPRIGAEPERGEGADPAPAERQHAGEDALDGRVLPGRRRTAVEAPAGGPAGAVERGEDQQASPKALPALLPIGLGAEGGNFNTVFRNTFTRIVVRNENIRTVLNEEGSGPPGDHDQDAARPAGGPDPPSNGPCQVGRDSRAEPMATVAHADVGRAAHEALGGPAVLAGPPDARLPRPLLRAGRWSSRSRSRSVRTASGA